METGVPKLKSHSINIDQSPNCPRCASSNTKFCYYNNYTLSQPRYFCNGCRRYWTEGGSLRNVPIGGTSRKCRRSTRASKNHDHQSVPVKCTNDQSGKKSTDIDLAAVYAKYVNPTNVEHEESYSTHPGTSTCASSSSSSLSFDNFLQANSLEINDDQIQKDQMDLISWSDIEAVLDPQLFNMYDDINMQDFVYQNSNAFEMHRMLGGGDFESQQSEMEIHDLGLAYKPL